MNDGDQPRITLPELELGARAYIFIGCAGLLVLWMGLSQDFGVLGLMPVLLGLLGLAPGLVPMDWKTAARVSRRVPSPWMPPLMLLSLVILHLFFGFPPLGAGGTGYDSFILGDLMIATGLLTYLLGQYRLYALRAHAVPPDPRLVRDGNDEPEVRPAQLFQVRELRWPLIVVPACVLLSQLLWRWVASASEWRLLDIPPLKFGLQDSLWRLFSLIWLLGVGTMILLGAGGIARLYRMSGAEARMTAQDVLWLETRGEQRRINRWLAWLRRKRGRKSGELP